jgi:hypothetical protein
VTDSMESKDWVGQMASNISREGNNGILKLEAENFERRDDQRAVMTIAVLPDSYECIYFGAGVLGIGSRLPFVTRGLIEFSA